MVTDETINKDGPIEKCKMKDVRKDPYELPTGFEWYTLDLSTEDDLQALFALLRDHYVEDSDGVFRFEYSIEFLKWALCTPNYKKDWHIGVRSTNGKLLAFISGTPVKTKVNDQTVKMAEINYLCVHKQLRKKKLAPVLIKEITRRVNLCDIW